MTHKANVLEARLAEERGEVPPEAVKQYLMKLYSKTGKDGGLAMTIGEWWGWWQQDGRWDRRGRALGCVQMRRIDPEKPLSLDNVKEVVIVGRRFGRVGAVVGPNGTRYGSVEEAAGAVGVSQNSMYMWALKGKRGWSFAEV